MKIIKSVLIIILTSILIYSKNVQIVSISTHEWIADTSNQGQVEFVLDSILDINTDSLWTAYAGTESKNLIFLKKIIDYGYRPYRDGYLDYLDITLSESFDLKENIITRIRFDAYIEGKPDSVIWRLSDSVRTIKIIPNDSIGIKYRLWLIPNSLGSPNVSPLETGLLPVISFNNGILKQRGDTNFIGDSSYIYTTDISLTLDSAAPVISKFLLQINACNPINPNNVVNISFSEVIRHENFPVYSGIDAFVLINGTDQDSIFMSTSILSGNRSNHILNPMEAWNYENEQFKMITYEALIIREKEYMFRPNVTKIRFAFDSSNIQIVDISDNNACNNINRQVTLLNDFPHYVCYFNDKHEYEGYDLSSMYVFRFSSNKYNEVIGLIDLIFKDNCLLTLSEDGLQEENRLIDLGDTLYSSVLEAPESGYISRLCFDSSSISDSLTGHTLVIKTREGNYAKMNILSIVEEKNAIYFESFYQPNGTRELIGIEINGKTLKSYFMDLNVFPNPFNPQTTISFPNPDGNAELAIYSIDGRKVYQRTVTRDQRSEVPSTSLGAGAGQRIVWNAAGQGSGVYVIVVRTKDKVLKKRVSLIK